MQKNYTRNYLRSKSRKRLPSKFYLDFSIFRDTKLTTFEAIVKHLKDNLDFTYREIGTILGRDERNIWTIYNRAIKKH